MKEKIISIQEEIKNYSGSGDENVEAFRVKYISKKSVINDLFEDFKKLSIQEKKEFGNCFGTPEFIEGTKAFMEKRQANFKGV